jgi:hypothetical protein
VVSEYFYVLAITHGVEVGTARQFADGVVEWFGIGGHD